MNYKCRGALLALMLTPLLTAAGEPGAGVARVTLANGNVTTQRGDTHDWTAARLGAPLVKGDRIDAARASRAEVQFDFLNFLRLGENADVRLTDLESRHYELQVSKGLVTYRILRDPPAEVEIVTPAVTVRPLKRGVYRIAVLEGGRTEVTVRDGKAEIASRQGTETLNHGRTMIFRLGATDKELQVREAHAQGKDDWDRWNEHRDQQITRGTGYRYGGPGIYGPNPYPYSYWYGDPLWGYGPYWYPPVLGFGFGGGLRFGHRR